MEGIVGSRFEAAGVAAAVSDSVVRLAALAAGTASAVMGGRVRDAGGAFFTAAARFAGAARFAPDSAAGTADGASGTARALRVAVRPGEAALPVPFVAAMAIRGPFRPRSPIPGRVIALRISDEGPAKRAWLGQTRRTLSDGDLTADRGDRRVGRARERTTL